MEDEELELQEIMARQKTDEQERFKKYTERKALRSSFLSHWQGIRELGFYGHISEFAWAFRVEAGDFIVLMLVSRLFDRYPEAGTLTYRQAWRQIETMLPELEKIVIHPVKGKGAK